jgi:hypothetical protein
MMSGSGLMLRACPEIKRSVKRNSVVCSQFSQNNSQKTAMAVVANNRTSGFAFRRGTRAVYKRNAWKGERQKASQQVFCVVLIAVCYRPNLCQMMLAEPAWFSV